MLTIPYRLRSARPRLVAARVLPSPQDASLTPLRGFGALLLFGVFMFVVAETVRRVSPQRLLGEGGAIEVAQLTLLGLSIALFSRASRREGPGSVFRAVAFLLVLAFVRELDGPLDRVWHGFWKVPALIVAAAAVCSLWPVREKLMASALRLSKTPTAGLVLSAAAVVLLQSRLLGQQSLWRGVLGEQFVSYVPRIVEETSELAGYGLFVLAAMEASRVSRLQLGGISDAAFAEPGGRSLLRRSRKGTSTGTTRSHRIT